MAPGDLAEARDLRGGFGEEAGEAPQGLVGVLTLRGRSTQAICSR
jgi:hypothetical protein